MYLAIMMMMMMLIGLPYKNIEVFFFSSLTIANYSLHTTWSLELAKLSSFNIRYTICVALFY